MIGVLCKPSEMEVVQEFFQLFKTSWEFYLPRHSYDLVLATTEEIPADLCPNVLVVYGSRTHSFDKENGILTRAIHSGVWLNWDGVEFPLYGDSAVFEAAGRPVVRRKGESDSVGLALDHATHQTVRVGYDLFKEVAYLLLKGQPKENAQIPTLEIHISLLRNIMLDAGLAFVEIPPVPAGYEFMACLTHDVDFTGICEHKLDYTMWGFVYRGLVSSLFDALRARIPWSKCRRNWQAVLSLPLVFLGWKDDFWLEFERYMKIEAGLGSTFFFVPFKGYRGTRGSKLAPRRRAVKYDISKMRRQIHTLIENDCEIGLHGIDAWQDSGKALAEYQRLCEVTGQSVAGVRMHWLYFAENSPTVLEEAGLSYDSTIGYNDAVGFHRGTSQAFSLSPAGNLLELPLIVQDTAMFYPDRTNLSEEEAMDSCSRLIQFISIFGGTLTVNWHTRSLSPERLWGDFYTRLLEEIRKSRVWFGTARQIVEWFRARRALRFEQVQFSGGRLCLKIAGRPADGHPPFLIRVYLPQSKVSKDFDVQTTTPAYTDTPWNGETELRVDLQNTVGYSQL
jgi:hypothetical protein